MTSDISIGGVAAAPPATPPITPNPRGGPPEARNAQTTPGAGGGKKKGLKPPASRVKDVERHFFLVYICVFSSVA